jgi:hypothetical protein
MKAKLFGVIGLALLPTLAYAADAGGAMKPDNAKAAGTGGGVGAAAPNTTNNSDDGSGKVGAQGAAASSQGAPGNETKPGSTNAAGTGGGEGSKMKPEKTP